MAFDGSGNFNRVMNWVADAAAGTKILATRHDSEDDNLAAGLSNTLTKDGQSQPTANIPMNGKKLVNLGAPTVGTDAATKTYVDGIRNFSTAINLTGATPAATIGFTTADVGFGTRTAGTPASYPARFVWNDKPDLSGTDIAVLDDTQIAFSIAANNVGFNTINTGGTNWAAMVTGFGGVLQYNKTNGAYSFYSGTASVAGGAAVTLGLLASLDKSGNFTTASSGAITSGNGIIASATINTVLASTGTTGSIYLRPNGAASAVNQVVVDAPTGNLVSSGALTALGGSIVNRAAASGNPISFWQTNAGFTCGYWYANLVSGDMSLENKMASGNGILLFSTTGSLTVNGTKMSCVSQFEAASTVWIGCATGAGTCYLRPNGGGSAVGQAYVDTSGNFAIASANAYKTTAGSWLATSDIRLKNVLGDYTSGLAEILQVHPKTYTYKATPEADPVIGVIAQDIEAFLPECVTQKEGDIDGEKVTDLRIYDMTPLTYALINAVKELSSQLEAATARIAALEGAAP